MGRWGWLLVSLWVVALVLPARAVSRGVVLEDLGFVILRGWYRGQRRARTMAFGVAFFLTTGTFQQLFQNGFLSIPSDWPAMFLPPLGLLAAFLAFAAAMGRHFTDTLAALDRSHTASRRFVPAAFLRTLGREEVVDVERGDAAAQTMAVLFADIRGFSTRSERHTSEENFAWLNRYLETVEPHIVAHGGFVNQYYGDGIMALFPEAEPAVAAARAMLDAVRSAEGLSDEGEPLRIGIGVHRGPLMLGTIGGADRLDTGVVGDAVNTAARIESLTKVYGRDLLISAQVRDQLSEPEAWEEVDVLAPKGKRERVTLYALPG